MARVGRYWNHRWVVDWSGATSNFTLPPMRSLFVPIQLLHGGVRWAKSCCAPSQAACKGTQRACFIDAEAARADGGVRDCCAARAAHELAPAVHELRLRLSVPPWAEARDHAGSEAGSTRGAHQATRVRRPYQIRV